MQQIQRLVEFSLDCCVDKEESRLDDLDRLSDFTRGRRMIYSAEVYISQGHGMIGQKHQFINT
jgi:hypothetical protein